MVAKAKARTRIKDQRSKPLPSGLDPLYVARRKAAFLARVDKRGPQAPGLEGRCWIWLGSFNGADYGQFVFGGRNIGAHRVSLALFGGQQLTPGLVVRHLCHRKCCVNPTHLVEGTYAENLRDRLERQEAERHHLPPTEEEQDAVDELWDILFGDEGAGDG